MAAEKVVEAVVDEIRTAGLVQIEVSARHVHLDKESVEALFGVGHKLTPKRELSQPGQYLEEERVDVIGPKGSFKNVAVLGPERKHVQVTIDEGAIVALRHVHMTPEDAEKLGLVDNQIVSVEALTDRKLVFEDTVIRVSPKFRTRMHVDVDEAGAAHIAGFALGKIIK